MQTPPRLTDRNALRLHRERSQVDALFLHEQALHEIKERLSEVNRTFHDVAIVTGHPEFWSAAFPDAAIVPDDEVLSLDPEAFDFSQARAVYASYLAGLFPRHFPLSADRQRKATA